MNAGAPRLHALTWTIWMLAAAFCTQAAPSPISITVVLVIAMFVVEVHGLKTPLARAFPVMVMLAASFGFVRVMISTLTTHTHLHVLFTMPAFTLPEWFGGFTVGGSIERTPLLQSVTDAYTIVGLIAAFAAWNALVSHHEVLRAVPRVFHEPALVVTIAVAFVPSTITALRNVLLADRARCGGTPVRRGRVRRLVLPVFEGGLERAIALAESMDSRGLGHSEPDRNESVAAWCSLVGLLCFVGAIVALISRVGGVASGLALIGCAFVVTAIVVASRGARRTRYRPRPITRVDLGVIAVVTTAAIGIGIASAIDVQALQWSADPLAWPEINVVVIALLLLLAAPLAVPHQLSTSNATGHATGQSDGRAAEHATVQSSGEASRQPTAASSPPTIGEAWAR